jgi:predicted dehydrogenase
MASKTFNVGVVGYGFSAKIFHIPFITSVPDFKLHAIVQRTPKPDDNAEKDHPGIKLYHSADDLAKDPKVDLVVITTAPDSHYDLAKLALSAGKHGVNPTFCVPELRVLISYVVVVEKPFVPTHKEAEELVALADSNKKLLAVYQSTYFCGRCLGLPDFSNHDFRSSLGRRLCHTVKACQEWLIGSSS